MLVGKKNSGSMIMKLGHLEATFTNTRSTAEMVSCNLSMIRLAHKRKMAKISEELQKTFSYFSLIFRVHLSGPPVSVDSEVRNPNFQISNWLLI